MSAAFHELGPRIGIAPACTALQVNRAGVYRERARLQGRSRPVRRRPRPPLALTSAEQNLLLGLLDSERFADVAPATVFATLLDEGRYHGSIRTMYRLLAAQNQTGERRRQRIHPLYAKPELLAVRPREVWSWDITKLKGPVKWETFHLYVILDIFSRYVVGWMLAARESAELAEQLIADTLEKQNVTPGTLTLHADRGTSMRSKPVAALLVDLDVARTHSRPHVSDDNPYSEAQFKTLKYRPDFPERFGSIEDARAHCQQFFPWYNTVHRHSGIAFMTPESVHYGRATALTATRRHARHRVRRESEPLQTHRPIAAGAAHRRLDQSAEKGPHIDHRHTRLLTNLMTPGVSMSLTRSAARTLVSVVVDAGFERFLSISLSGCAAG
jgi:putative transposase